ncbi:flavin reductase family protein [Dyadobacter sp. NIV53]|uniref:flavin reductase family protein n=1 Tax=Dyadobacter sp. NIV53 TaxID=2861765 RepID=UPI001C86E8C3|nr:flavin reductase [Dyadobacter sp. NIV53]
MKHFTNQDIQELSKYYRANLINSITGYKPANLIGTVSETGETNLAVFSSVVHLGANPPLVGMIIRPATVPRHSYENILATGYYTINHVHESFVEKAHFTSANFERTDSEFDTCKLQAEYINGFEAPFVQESNVKLGMKFLQEIPIELNGTILIIGQIEHLILPEEIIGEDGNVDLESVETICVSGLESYSKVGKLAKFEYARVKNVPDFENS